MGRHKVVILGPEDASIEAEKAEMSDLDVEFVQAESAERRAKRWRWSRTPTPS